MWPLPLRYGVVNLENKALRTTGLQRALLLIEEVTQEAVDLTI